MNKKARDQHHEHDDFEQWFQNWANQAHERESRASAPSSEVWSRFLEATDEHHAGSTLPSRRVTNPPGTRSVFHHSVPKSPPSFGHSWTTTIAVMVAIVLLGAGFWFSPMGPGSVFDEDKPIRHAAEVLGPATTSESTPDLSSYLPLEIPGVTCDVEPLTEDEVMSIVMNPHTRTASLFGQDSYLPSGLFEIDPFRRGDWYPPNVLADGRTPDASEYEIFSGWADQFWSCLRVGTSYQVWNLMDPTLVQIEILANFPVFRDEATVRAYIAKYGDLRYSAAIAHVFPDLDGGIGETSERYADPDPGTGTVQDTDTGYGYIYVNMPLRSEPGSAITLILQQYPSGTWRAAGVYFPG